MKKKIFRENWDFLPLLILYLATSSRERTRTNELVHLHCVCYSVALLARTCTCFASPSRLHHHRRRFRKCRPLWHVARGRFRILSGPTTRFARAASRLFWIFPGRQTRSGSRAFVILAAAGARARKKGRAANCSLLRQINGRSLSKTWNYSLPGCVLLATDKYASSYKFSRLRKVPNAIFVCYLNLLLP